MDAASNVKIEYTDPSGIFSTFASQLVPQLPLKDLHWSSSSRPTRSISRLYIDLVADDRSRSHSVETFTEGSASHQENGVSSRYEGPRKERRHQIPGLRRTPYLKIFLLSCNDVDTYKGSLRKNLRDWVKDNSPSSRSSSALNKQDNHDAFEWLIVHVLPPSSDSSHKASRPPSNQGDVTTEKRPSASRWTSRNSASVIEKLRSDFNSTSKSAVDRVAQVQLVEPPLDLSFSVDHQIHDSKSGWDDLTSKLKSLILASFGLRVSQYEDDIKEREGQKKVFGWNFNTFFVLKEGLAMGFENMGLLEDALTVYKELDFGLKTAIEEQQTEVAEQQTTHFVGYTDDLYKAFKRATISSEPLSSNDLGDSGYPGDPGTFLLKTNRKPFRELILSNKISIFDFQCYVFAREFNLSLGLANVDNDQAPPNKTGNSRNEMSDKDDLDGDATDLSKPSDYEPENLFLLAEMARSSLEFITSATRIIREDVQSAITHSKTSQDENDGVRVAVIETFVMSWLFSASQCILEKISVRSLSLQLNPLLRQLTPKTTAPKVDADGDQSANKVNEVHREDLPVRTSSLLSSAPIRSSSPPARQFPSVSFLDATKLLPPDNPHPGSQDLAAGLGDLIALKRRNLCNLGTRSGRWPGETSGTDHDLNEKEAEMQDVELGEIPLQIETDTTSALTIENPSSTVGLCNANLLLAVRSYEEFNKTYEELTVSALAHYVIGNRSKAAEAMTADIAVARYQLKDYGVAASYFRQLAPFYANTKWSALERAMLDRYALCLKELKQYEDYVRISLKILAKVIRDSVTVEREMRSHYRNPQETKPCFGGARDYLSSTLAASKLCKIEFSVSLEDYFGNIELGKDIRHFPHQDGFELDLNIRSFLPEELVAQSVQVRLLPQKAEYRSELWLSTERAQGIKSGFARVCLQSKMLQAGWFFLDRINIKSSNVNFTLDLSPIIQQAGLFPRNRESTSSTLSKDSIDRYSLFLWPKLENLDLLVTHYEAVNLEQQSSIKVIIGTRQNSVIKCKLSLRAASAGLRLHTAEAKALEENTIIIDKAESGTINMANLSPNTETSIIIPYSIESDLREISLRALLEYTTPKGDFTFGCNANISILLPLAINVQDLFKKATLISKFTIGTSSTVPVRVYSCHLDSNPDFRVITPPWKFDELDVFVRQPLTLVSKIVRNKTSSRSPNNKLFLKVKYRCIDEIIYRTVQRQFEDAIDATPYKKISRALVPVVLASLRSRLAVQDLESICLLREVDLGAFDEWDWESLLAGLSSETCEGLEIWLRRWHEENRKTSLDGEDMSLVMQDLTVPVEIPQMQVVHTARLRRLVEPSDSPHLDSIPIGQGIPMELAISHTRSWDGEHLRRTEGQTLDFCFEVQANPEVWIVGGQRRAHFSSQENEESKFGLLLWPQKTGHLVLPSLEIHSLEPSPEQTGEEELSRESTISCELDYQNVGETILVVPDLVSTTVALDPSGPGGSWLVGSQSRTI